MCVVIFPKYCNMARLGIAYIQARNAAMVFWHGHAEEKRPCRDSFLPLSNHGSHSVMEAPQQAFTSAGPVKHGAAHGASNAPYQQHPQNSKGQ